MKPFVVAANWKLNKDPSESVQFFKDFLPKVDGRPEQNQILFFVPAINLWVTQEILRNTNVGFGPQNIYSELSGAFTGENSAQVAKNIGCTHCLIGHSERRSIFSESDSDVAAKVKTSLDQGLVPVICVGETLEERESGKTSERVLTQVRAAMDVLSNDDLFIIAYEPVWAIGTGKVATPEQAEEVHALIRKELTDRYSSDKADQVAILYGGSVKPENATELKSQKNIDGFLVGGASLKVDSFSSLSNID